MEKVTHSNRDFTQLILSLTLTATVPISAFKSRSLTFYHSCTDVLINSDKIALLSEIIRSI
jgi:hypothetical protein